MGSLKEQSVKIKKALPSNVRVLLFSATFQDEDDEQDEQKKKELKKQGEEEELKFLEFAAKVVPEPVVKILIPKEELSLKKIRQYSVECKNQSEKYQVLKNIYSDLTIAQCIIFVNTRETANKLTEDLRRDGFPVSLLHGKVDSSERKIILQDFQEAKTKVLITTNVLSRGVDIRQVTHVINYDPPMTAEKKPDVSSYLHRIGRTGRFGREGIAINLISGETDKKTLNEIVKFYEKSIISISPDADFGEEIK
jgi:ATP-dependent RNA helicase DDX19/DBP5